MFLNNTILQAVMPGYERLMIELRELHATVVSPLFDITTQLPVPCKREAQQYVWQLMFPSLLGTAVS
jgi:hypothetical protein